MAGNSHHAFLVIMFLLPMASSFSYHEPAILFNHFYGLFDFHGFCGPGALLDVGKIG
jgi:hypothetical protein